LLRIHEKVLDLCDAFVAFVTSYMAGLQRAEVIAVKNRRFTVIRPLGEGGFAYVFLVKETTPGILPSETLMYAIKRIRVHLPEHEHRLRAEVFAHGAVDSPFVMKLVDSVILRGAELRRRDGGSGNRAQAVNPMELPLLAEGLLVLPYYDGGSAQDLIDSIPPGDSLPLGTILDIAINVAKGLLAFHQKNPPLAFRDLKPANILLEHPHSTKAILIDLGSVAPARLKLNSRREAVALQELCAETVTAPFRPPELFDPASDATIDERSDVWSFGCTLWTIAYQTPPFDGTMTATVGGQLIFPSKDPYGPQFRSLLKDILVTDIQKRLFMVQILQHLESLRSSAGSM
ncbi:Serine/threonine-protein kinase 16, partial [Entophlyctis sp. JEL0112]